MRGVRHRGQRWATGCGALTHPDDVSELSAAACHVQGIARRCLPPDHPVFRAPLAPDTRFRELGDPSVKTAEPSAARLAVIRRCVNPASLAGIGPP